MSRIIPILILLISLSFDLFSQGYNTVKGYIIVSSGDTVHGELRYRQSFEDEISFRSYSKTDFREYLPGEIFGFTIGSEKVYRSVAATDEHSGNQQKFLLQLVEGVTSLYYSESGYFIIMKENKDYRIDKKPDEVKRIQEDPSGPVRTIVIEDKRYIGVVRNLVMDCPPLFKRTEDLQFSIKEMSRLIRDYNRIMSPGSVLTVRDRVSKAPFRVGLRGAIFINHMVNFPDDGRYVNDNFDSRLCFSGGAIASIPFSNKLAAQTGLIFTGRGGYLFRENEYGDPEEIDWKLTYMEIPILMSYTFPMSKISPYLIGGGLVGFKIADKSDVRTIYTTKTGMESLEFGFRTGAGIGLGKSGTERLRIEYYFEQALTNVYSTHLRYHHNAHCISVIFLIR